MKSNRTDEDRRGAAPGCLWGTARIIVGVLGLVAILVGFAFAREFFTAFQWWAALLGVFCLAGGGWFVWIAVFGRREGIDEIITEFVCRLLDEIF